MKFITILIATMLSLLTQSNHEEIIMEDVINLTTEKTVVIDNLFGNIQIKSGKDKVLNYRVTKSFDAKTASGLEKGIKEVQLKVLNRNDSIIFFVDAPNICSQWKGCQHQHSYWNNPPYDFRFDYIVELPASLNADISTIDNGDLTIEGITGVIKVNNVNGDITLKKAKYVASASTINGDISIHYLDVPLTNGEFNTINGSINIYCSKNLNAVVKAKSMHGELYTDFEYEQMKPELSRQKVKNTEETHYKLEETFAIQIGKSGPLLSVETLNGNMYLQKF